VGREPRHHAALAPGGGDMGAAVRSHDWSATPLGAIETWSPELRTAAEMVLESRFPQALIWGPELTTLYNDAYAIVLYGKHAPLGRSFRDNWREIWPSVQPIVDKAFAGQSSYFEEYMLEVARSEGLRRAWFTFAYSPVRLSDGSVGGMLDTVIDVTAQVQARETAQVLREELAHRLKNTMAMVQSLAQRTLSGVTERDAVRTFEKRIVALGHAHEVLSRGGQVASLDELADGLLAMHGDRFDVSGPEVTMGASAALRMSLILHELATNAVKYGALSLPEGRVALHWHFEPNDEAGDDLVVCWREAGGPVVCEPTRFGFGTRLIDLGLMGTGKVARRYPSDGMQADLRVPVRDLAER
jgi:two-component sensor histidine kinase